MQQSKFNVLWMNFNGKVEFYDVLPYFRNEFKKLKPKDRPTEESFKQWVTNMGMYRFWSRCEYEFIIKSWPYDNWWDYDKVKTLEEAKERSKRAESKYTKIDVWEQIEANIDVICEILKKELL